MNRGTAPPRPGTPAYPFWVVVPYTLWVTVLVPVYWVEHGPANFLWFSDIALFALLIALWTGWRLPYSMMAVGVMPFELVWLADFATGGNLIGLAAYMFDPDEPAHLRALSLFHLFLVPIMIWMLVRQGYAPAAVRWQTALAWIVLPASYAFSSVEANVNVVFGPTGDPQQVVHPLVYLALMMTLLPIVVHWPMHLLLKRLFGREQTR
jgi:hypothetical protein